MYNGVTPAAAAGPCSCFWPLLLLQGCSRLTSLELIDCEIYDTDHAADALQLFSQVTASASWVANLDAVKCANGGLACAWERMQPPLRQGTHLRGAAAETVSTG